MTKKQTQKDWYESSATYQQYKACQDEARLLWEEEHKTPCNLTEALVWLARLHDRADDYYRIKSNLSPDKLSSQITGRLACPKCGSSLEFEYMPSCPKANPFKYAGFFICSRDECVYHAYTTVGLIDARNAVRDGRALDLVEGKL